MAVFTITCEHEADTWPHTCSDMATRTVGYVTDEGSHVELRVCRQHVSPTLGRIHPHQPLYIIDL